jgi:hypothetical protein
LLGLPFLDATFTAAVLYFFLSLFIGKVGEHLERNCKTQVKSFQSKLCRAVFWEILLRLRK